MMHNKQNFMHNAQNTQNGKGLADKQNTASATVLLAKQRCLRVLRRFVQARSCTGSSLGDRNSCRVRIAFDWSADQEQKHHDMHDQ